MKTIPVILLTLFLISCQGAKAQTYEEGLANCTRIQKERIASIEGRISFVGADCMEGSQIPEFEAHTMEGKTLNRELLKGKLSIINFWFITCPPCVAEIPGFNAIVEKFGADKINYVAIGRDYKQDIVEFLGEHPWHFDHITDGSELIKDHFKIRWGFPTTYLLNKNAEIILAFSGGMTDETAVQEIQDKLIPAIENALK